MSEETIEFDSDRWVAVVIGVIGDRLDHDLANERARGILSAFFVLEPEDNPAEIALEALKLVREEERGSLEIDDDSLRLMAVEIVTGLERENFF